MKKLVLLGAGHAHLTTIHGIPRLRENGVAVTVVDPSPDLYYSGMVSSVIGGTVSTAGARINTRTLVERGGGSFIEAVADSIDVGARTVSLADGSILRWDILGCAVGSVSRLPVTVPSELQQTVVPLKPFHRPETFWESVLRGRPDEPRRDGGAPHRIAVVGGGATGVEIAGNIVRRASDHGVDVVVTLYTQGEALLGQFPSLAGTIARRHLERAGVTVHTGKELAAIEAGTLRFADGKNAAYDTLVAAAGLEVPSVFRRSGLPVTDDGALVVDENLNAGPQPVFGGGDCVAFSPQRLRRIGVHAVYQAPVLFNNFIASARGAGASLRRYDPPGQSLQILNLGDGCGLAIRGNTVRCGRWWLRLKERIDWGYVRSEGRSIRPSLFPPPR